MRAVFFDLDGTLLHFTRDYREILSDAMEAVVGEVRDEWIDAYNTSFFDHFEECEPQPYRQAFATIPDDPDLDALVDALREREVNACHPPKNALDDLNRLSEEYSLGVLTNGVPEWQEHKLQANGLDSYFDAVVTSYDAGTPKPDHAPFRLAEKRLPADDYAMVGDADSDIEGARKAGWTAYEYHEQGFGDLPDALE